jgi:hypothetical protein
LVLDVYPYGGQLLSVVVFPLPPSVLASLVDPGSFRDAHTQFLYPFSYRSRVKAS